MLLLVDCSYEPGFLKAQACLTKAPDLLSAGQRGRRSSSRGERHACAVAGERAVRCAAVALPGPQLPAAALAAASCRAGCSRGQTASLL